MESWPGGRALRERREASVTLRCGRVEATAALSAAPILLLTPTLLCFLESAAYLVLLPSPPPPLPF
eukprot:342940-Pleurochrysis_carterae.AAC.1